MSTKPLSKLAELKLKIDEKNAEVLKIHDSVDEATGQKYTDDQVAKVKELNKEIEELEKEATGTKEWQDSHAAAIARSKAPAMDRIHPGLIESINQKTLGQEVLENPEFKAYLDQLTDFGKRAPGKNERVNSPAVQVKSLITGLSSTSAGAFVVNDRKPIVDPGTFYRPLSLLDIITIGQTGSDVVEYVREGAHTNNAATVEEATASDDDTGAKPESAMLFSVVTEAVATIAHWVPATRRALADAPQMRTIIEQFLRYGIREELEDQMITGNGAGDDFVGVLNVSGNTPQAWDTDILTTTRKARTKVRTTGRATPTAYVLNPADWETIDLMQDNEARYFFGGPSQMGTPRLWGLPVVECEGMTAGTGMVADWKLAVLWDREQTNILISDSHADFFIRNLIAVLAEMRAAFGVLRPAAFVEIDLTA